MLPEERRDQKCEGAREMADGRDGRWVAGERKMGLVASLNSLPDQWAASYQLRAEAG